LSAQVSADTIRRAYLRGVRAHPPERDPEGFRRIRDAYELLKDSPWLWEMARPVSVPVEGIAGRIELGGLVPVKPEPAVQGDAPGGGATSDVRSESEFPSLDDDDAPSSGEDTDPSFAPSPEWAELSAAMERGDYELAAHRLHAAMGSGEEGKIQVYPWQVLECALGLFEQGQGKRARELVGRLDEWTERQGLHPGHVGAAVAARWQLSKELAALSGRVDKEVVKRLAKDVKSGEFFRSRDLIEREQKLDRTLRGALQHHAPTLFKAARPSAAEIQMGNAFRTVSPWNYAWLLAFGFFQCVRWMTSTSSETKTEVATQQRKSAEQTTGESTRGASEYRQNQLRIGSERAIDDSLNEGACNQVRDQWPGYVATLRGSVSDYDASYKLRRSAVLAMCPELANELPEQP
jgi:hypothetical protein